MGAKNKLTDQTTEILKTASKPTIYFFIDIARRSRAIKTNEAYTRDVEQKQNSVTKT